MEEVRTLTRASPDRGQGEMDLGQRGDQEDDGRSTGAKELLCGKQRNFQKENHLCSNPPIRPVGESGWKPLLSKRHMEQRLEVNKRILMMDSRTVGNKIAGPMKQLERTGVVFVLRCRVRHANTIPTVRHGSVGIMLWIPFFQGLGD